MGDRNKLPKWAQQEIEDLERRVKNAERMAEAMRLETDPETSNTYITPMWGKEVGLPSAERVNFRLGERMEIQCRVEKDHHGEALLYLNGSGGLLIEPQVSNVIRVKVNKR